MLVKRLSEAQPYEAPRHYDMRSLRLQGFEPGGPTVAWVGLSHFQPGGGASDSASPLERVYVVLSGAMTVIAGGQEATLGPLDSCCIPGGESRQIRNAGADVATMLVIIPYAPATA
jgi:quercetin dioxygenase-like cupin family protein